MISSLRIIDSPIIYRLYVRFMAVSIIVVSYSSVFRSFTNREYLRDNKK